MIDKVPAFLIDEPLQITIGMSDEIFFKLINDLLISLDIHRIYVKRHPRSQLKKFSDRENIIEIDEVPKNTNLLIGYKSNLLFCGISTEKFYQFKGDNLIETDSSFLNGPSNLNINDYSQLSEEDFICV